MTEYRLEESKALEERLIKNLQEEYAGLRLGIHMSDLVLCLRQSLARKLYPLPPTTKQLGYFFDGARRHEALQELYGPDGVAEKHGEFEGVSYSIDLYDKKPIEFKTTRANKALSDHWMRQLAYYMVAVGASKGILQVQRINDKEGTPLPAYVILMDENQRRHTLEEFRERRDAFKAAWEKKDLALVPVFRGDGDWLCRDCAYRGKCDAIER
jgi:hypothetical protein